MNALKAIRKSGFFWGCLVLIVAAFTYQLTIRHLPPGILNDEADISYEAYSISQTGKDQWGNDLPLSYFSGFGGTRLPQLVYWTVPFVKVMGLNAESVRMAGVFAGLLTVFGFFLLVKKLYDPPVAATASILLIITPWFWGLTRTANEAVLAVGLTLWAVWLLFESKNREIFIILSSFLFGLSAYTYFSNQVFIPLFLVPLIWGITWLRRGNLRLRIISIVLLLIMVSPLLIKTAKGSGSAIRLTQTGLTSNVALVGELNYKLGVCEQNTSANWCRVVYNRPTMWLWQFFANYLNHFSPTFLFSDNWFVGILPPGRLFYLSFIPGLLYGIWTLNKEKSDRKWLWISWLLLAPVADSLTSNGHAMRSFLIVPPLVAVSTTGWISLFRKLRHPKFSGAVFVAVLAFLIFEICQFASDYWWYFPKKNSVYTHYQYKPLFARLLSLEKNYQNIYVSNSFSSVKQYAFYVFYSQYDPRKFQSGSDIEWTRETDGWIWVQRIGKWHFVKILPPLSTVPEGSLMAADPDETREISGPWSTNADGKTVLILERLEDVKYLSGDKAFTISIVKRVPQDSIKIIK